MNIMPINNASFQSKYKFPIRSHSYPKGDEIITETAYILSENPKAGELYNRLLGSSSSYQREMARYEMGDYEIIKETTKTPKILDSLKHLVRKKAQ